MRSPSTAAPCGQSVGQAARAPPGIRGALIVRYLATNPAFEGIGAARASRLWETFGPELYRVLGSGDADTLATVLGEDRAQSLVAAWKESLAEADVIVWLDEQGFDARLGAKAVRFWGREALARLRENPYVLMALAGWAQVDAAARRLGVGSDDPRRQVAAVEAVLYQRLDRSHTWTSAADLEASVARLLSMPRARAQDAIRLAAAEGAAVLIDGGYQPLGAHVMERFVADRVAAMLRPRDTEDLLVGARTTASIIRASLDEPPLPGGLVLNPGQRRAVEMALTSSLGLLLGGAGVGKTAALAAVHRAAERCGVAVIQMALAGRAAMRMRDATGRPARTIASFLGAAAKGELRLGPDTLVVIDEASMLDLPLLYSVLRQMGDGCRLLLVGDPAQLPPIKFGLTFHLLAEQPGVPKVELTEVHRQAAETGIPAVAGAIRRGEMPELPPFSPSVRRGVSFVDCEPGQAAAVITDILSRLGDVGGETRVLAAVRAGPAGVEAINAHLHGLRAPGRARVPGRALAVGDPVMFTRNDYGRELWNGTLGTLVAAGGSLPPVAEFDGRQVSLSEADLGDLALAYCLTVHKAQGSQFRRIVMPAFPALLLDRTLLYTAVTRATEQVVLVGDRSAMARGVVASPCSLMRKTALVDMLALGHEASDTPRGGYVQGRSSDDGPCG